MYYCSVPVHELLFNLYNKVYPIHDIYEKNNHVPGDIVENGFTILPSTVANSGEKIEVNGIYLIDNA